MNKIISNMFSHSLLIAWVFLCCFSKDLSGNEPEVIINTIPVSCNGGSDGEIRIMIPDVSQVFTAQIYKYSPSGNLVKAQRSNDTTSFFTSGLPAGKYLIEIKGDSGFSFTQSIEVPQPDKLEAGKIDVLKKLTTPDANDASLAAIASGGILPYAYSWNIEGENKNLRVIEHVGQGTYTCIINDANQCGPVKATILFNQYVIPDIVEE